MRSSRRQFCGIAGRLFAGAGLLYHLQPSLGQGASGVHFSVAEFDRARILAAADAAVGHSALTLPKVAAPGKQNPQTFYSEKAQQGGDASPILRHDILPDIESDSAPFLGHVDALVAMNSNLSALTAAWRLTGKPAYLTAAVQQLQAWFLDSQTRMLPNLEMAGVVPGVDDDRNTGFTGATALAESARAAAFLCTAPSLPTAVGTGMRAWFADLLQWLVDSKKGDIARQAKSLESIAWTMLAAEFSRFTRNAEQYRACAHLFREGLLRQMNFDGNFDTALRTANPYSTSMFTLECMAAACESLSTPFESLWNAALPDGRGMHSAVAWALPFLQDRAKWPYLSDRDNFKSQPVRQNALLFAGRAYDLPDYISVWKNLPPEAGVAAIARTHPITQPALWTTRPPA